MGRRGRPKNTPEKKTSSRKTTVKETQEATWMKRLEDRSHKLDKEVHKVFCVGDNGDNWEIIEKKNTDESIVPRPGDFTLGDFIQKDSTLVETPQEAVNDFIMIENLLADNPVSKLSKQAGIGQAAYIIGGGHSWQEYSILLNAVSDRTFGCSGVPLLFPQLKHWYSCDVLKSEPMVDWFWNSKDTKKVLCYEAWREQAIPKDCFITMTPPHGPVDEPEKHGLWHGCSSVIGAMETARLMGYRVFYLFGVDYTETTHPFDSLDPKQAEGRQPWKRERIQNHWTMVRNYYLDFRCVIYNTNPDSLLVRLNLQNYIEPAKAFSL